MDVSEVNLIIEMVSPNDPHLANGGVEGSHVVLSDRPRQLAARLLVVLEGSVRSERIVWRFKMIHKMHTGLVLQVKIHWAMLRSGMRASPSSSMFSTGILAALPFLWNKSPFKSNILGPFNTHSHSG